MCILNKLYCYISSRSRLCDPVFRFILPDTAVKGVVRNLHCAVPRDAIECRLIDVRDCRVQTGEHLLFLFPDHPLDNQGIQAVTRPVIGIRQLERLDERTFLLICHKEDENHLQKIEGFVLHYDSHNDCTSYNEFLAYAKRKGYKPGWAYYQALKRGLL